MVDFLKGFLKKKNSPTNCKVKASYAYLPALLEEYRITPEELKILDDTFTDLIQDYPKIISYYDEAIRTLEHIATEPEKYNTTEIVAHNKLIEAKEKRDLVVRRAVAMQSIGGKIHNLIGDFKI